MERLRATLRFGGILSDETIEILLTRFEEVNLKAGDEFSSLGKIADRMGFVNEGIIRCYSISPKGEDVTKYFVKPNQFAIDLESYYDQKPAETALQAVVETQLFTVTRSSWEKSAEEFPKLFILTKSLTEANLLNKIKDNDFLNFGTAQEKYLEFINRYPNLALHIPQQYIASYLKITPQSLSRIRKKLTENS